MVESPCIVFRLEMEDGSGIYTSNIAVDICSELGQEDLAYSDDRHPTPYRDSRLMQSYADLHPEDSRMLFMHAYKFGFSSYQQFRAWFYSDEFLEACRDRDVFLAIYSVSRSVDPDSMIDGNAQCIFKPDHAVRIAFLDPLASRETCEKAIALAQNQV